MHRASCEGVGPATLLRIAGETLAVARQVDLPHVGNVTPRDSAHMSGTAFALDTDRQLFRHILHLYRV
jgi:hypothetical protein